MKRLLIVLAVCLGLLLLINLVVGVLSSDQWAFDTALAKCREHGWRDQDLVSASSKVSGGPFGRTATIEFQLRDKDQPKTIRVLLRKPVNFFAWQVVDYQEQGHQD
jgi:hypothetical protein